MAEELPSLQIDTDWKRQAQEEKKKLAEQQQKAPPAPAAPLVGAALPPGPASPARGAGAARGGEARGRRELPQASIATLIQTLTAQALTYLGEVPTSAGPVVNLDVAKHQIDTLGVLEEKTRNNLTEDEQHALDLALYQIRMRFISVATQYI